jgi:hypothetical protein
VRKVAAVLVAVAFVLDTATPAQANIVRICHARDQGDYPSAVASCPVNYPRRIWVTIKARPKQYAWGNYSMVCSKGTGDDRRHGNYSGTTPFSLALTMPYRRPDKCWVAATGILNQPGTVIVILTARV